MRAPVFHRVCDGLYTDVKWRMTIDYEAVWSKAEGRKWVARWRTTTCMGLGASQERSRKFDSLTEARRFLVEMAKGCA